MTLVSALPDSDVTEANQESELPPLPDLVAMPEIVPLPDRADAPISEITERFFKAIVAKVPIDRIEELHLFSPLRSGGVETGIAVVAARVPVVVLGPAAQPEQQFEHELETEAATASETEIVQDAIAAPDDESEPDPYAPDALHEIVADAIEASVEYVAEESPAVAVERHTVYTARYRLVQKGIDRGKWEADVVDEADAPLITVEMVVRGVQRRAGEATETTRYSGSQIARALRLG